jgi:aliphatic nitrilase
MLPRLKAAAVHAAPGFLDKQATTKKAISLIREAAAAGAEIVVPKPSFWLFRCGPPCIGF